MKTVSTLALVLGLSIVSIACSKADPSATVTSNAATVAGAAATTATPAAATAATPAKPAFVQKGIKPGKIVVGYMLDSADPSQCAVVTDDPAKKETFTKNADKLAAMMKGKIVAIPDRERRRHVQRRLRHARQLLRPEVDGQVRQEDCTSKPHQTWVE